MTYPHTRLGPRPLIGLIGKKRAGKDTFASGLIEHDFRRVAFADPLKRAAVTADPLVRTRWGHARLSALVQSDGWELAKECPDVRRLLQRFGQGIREIDPEFWLRAALEQVDAEQERGHGVVITDVRYPNEADAIRARGGLLVRIVRAGLESNDEHASEVALDHYAEDRLALNNGSIDHLQAQAATLAEEVWRA